MAQKMKLKDIASILGVSPATVSRALKNDQHISVETRKKCSRDGKICSFNTVPNTD